MCTTCFLSWRNLTVTVAALALFGASGCGGKRLYPVRGEVVFKDGTPVKGGLVIFEPADANVKVSARGEIQPDGTFQLGTDANDDGALEGKYRVVVMPPPRLSEKEPVRSEIPDHYQRAATTDLTATVTRDKAHNHFHFQIDRQDASHRKK